MNINTFEFVPFKTEACINNGASGSSMRPNAYPIAINVYIYIYIFIYIYLYVYMHKYAQIC
jgi:hypothetical protein